MSLQRVFNTSEIQKQGLNLFQFPYTIHVSLFWFIKKGTKICLKGANFFYSFGLLLQVLTYMMTVESGHVQQTACRSWFRSQTPQSWWSVNSRVIHPIQSSLVCINIHQEVNLSLNWPSSYFVLQSIFIKWLFFSIILSVFVDVLEFIIWW